MISAANVLWFTAMGFAGSAILLSLSVAAAVKTETSQHEPYLLAMRGGWKFLRGQRILLAMTAMVALTNLLDQAKTAVLMPVWVTDIMFDPAVSGWVFGSAGVGAVCGNVLFIWLAPKLPRRMTFAVCYLLGGGSQYFALAFFTDTFAILTITFASGFAGAALNPILSAVSFSRVPDELRARVFGITGALAFVGIPFGGLLGGVAVDAFGVINALWLAGGLCLLITLAPFVFPVWREMDRRPEPATVAAASPA